MQARQDKIKEKVCWPFHRTYPHPLSFFLFVFGYLQSESTDEKENLFCSSTFLGQQKRCARTNSFLFSSFRSAEDLKNSMKIIISLFIDMLREIDAKKSN